MSDATCMDGEGIDTDQFKWQKAAPCRLAPSYVFFPEEQLQPGFVPDPEVGDYKSFCNTCKVKTVCLEFAMIHDLQGIWGGLTDRQRARRYHQEEREDLRQMKEEIGEYKKLYGHS